LITSTNSMLACVEITNALTHLVKVFKSDDNLEVYILSSQRLLGQSK